MRSVPARGSRCFVTARGLHGRTLADIVEKLGDRRAVWFLRRCDRQARRPDHAGAANLR